MDPLTKFWEGVDKYLKEIGWFLVTLFGVAFSSASSKDTWDVYGLISLTLIIIGCNGLWTCGYNRGREENR